jgi:glycosyltransferase involved in cell wall biosynthesis
VFTTSDIREPRAVRHAIALAKRFPTAEVAFVDLHPAGEPILAPGRLSEQPNVKRRSASVPHRKNNIAALAFERVLLAGAQMGPTVQFLKRSCSIQSNILRRVVGNIAADLYVGHNVGALPILSDLKARFGGLTVYDNMEVYSGMDEQSGLEQQRIRAIEKAFIPTCDLVLTTTEMMNEFLVREYGLKKCVCVYNCPPITQELGAKLGGFHLYWRNTVIGLGGRGLDDVLRALVLLPKDVILHLQGRSTGGTDGVHRLASSLKVSDRVRFHDPYEPEQAVAMAAPYSVGLCLERNTCKNNQLTASNKIFDYHMAGLAVVCSDMPALCQIVQSSRAGLTFKNANPDDLCRAILRLYSDKELLIEKQRNARLFAVEFGNEERQMNLLMSQIDELVSWRGISPERTLLTPIFHQAR